MAELADALDSKSSGAIRAGSSPASGIRIKDLTEKSVRSLLYTIKKHERNKKMEKDKAVTENTIVFNNLVNTIEDWNDNWEVPAGDSWHSRFF